MRGFVGADVFISLFLEYLFNEHRVSIPYFVKMLAAPSLLAPLA
jgi:hypothetical protein